MRAGQREREEGERREARECKGLKFEVHIPYTYTYTWPVTVTTYRRQF